MTKYNIAALVVMLLLQASYAAATPEFPSVIASFVPTPSIPSCSICHHGDPGSGTVTTSFGMTMVQLGLLPHDDASLITALGVLKTAQVGSVEHGYFLALKDGTDPQASNPEPQYGCQQIPLSSVALCWVVLCLGWLWRKTKQLNCPS